jgi:zinc and cadmium transporter
MNNMNTLIAIILSTVLISIISLVGIFAIFMQKKTLHSIINYLVAFSIGGLIAGAFFNLIPEAQEALSYQTTFLFVCLGLLIFFLIEKILHWRHCHDDNCKVHSFAYTSLVGDSIHNFLDGIVIAAAFLVNIGAGIATSLAIIFHEIPQELGDFGVLIRAGFTKQKALFYNLLTALTCIIGGIIGFIFLNKINFIVPYIIAITAGGFIYVAVSDLIPEIRSELSLKKSIINILIIAIAIIIMLFIGKLE